MQGWCLDQKNGTSDDNPVEAYISLKLLTQLLPAPAPIRPAQVAEATKGLDSGCPSFGSEIFLALSTCPVFSSYCRAAIEKPLGSMPTSLMGGHLLL